MGKGRVQREPSLGAAPKCGLTPRSAERRYEYAERRYARIGDEPLGKGMDPTP